MCIWFEFLFIFSKFKSKSVIKTGNYKSFFILFYLKKIIKPIHIFLGTSLLTQYFLPSAHKFDLEFVIYIT